MDMFVIAWTKNERRENESGSSKCAMQSQSNVQQRNDNQSEQGLGGVVAESNKKRNGFIPKSLGHS